MDPTSTRPAAPTSKGMYWTGVVISTLPVLMLLFSASMKFVQPGSFAQDFKDQMGYPIRLAVVIGVVEIICTIIYAIPQTAVLGAILLTGYLGGATATHVRIEDPFYVVAGPIIFGVLVWLGLFLRDSRIRALVPWRR